MEESLDLFFCFSSADKQPTFTALRAGRSSAYPRTRTEPRAVKKGASLLRNAGRSFCFSYSCLCLNCPLVVSLSLSVSLSTVSLRNCCIRRAANRAITSWAAPASLGVSVTPQCFYLQLWQLHRSSQEEEEKPSAEIKKTSLMASATLLFPVGMSPQVGFYRPWFRLKNLIRPNFRSSQNNKKEQTDSGIQTNK